MHNLHECIHDATRVGFGFLEKDYGFTCAEDDCNRVRFDSGRVFVQVVYDATRSFEVTVEMGQPDCEGPPYNFAEFLRAFAVADHLELSAVQAADVVVARKFVERFAEVLQRHGTAVMRGDEEGFRKLQAQRNSDCNAYERERRLERGTSVAERAWNDGDYGGVVAALTPVEGDLSAAQRKKLELARKRSLLAD
ncbi:MAG: hypothetical protein P8Q97_01765 [Myxococcota bacterium]|jgi:hypothetical protein|nr:hypothetical protein [Myxococcota bacterium]